MQSPLLAQQQSSVTIKVPSGTDVHYLAKQLKQAGLLKHSRLFVLLARVNGDARRLKVGEYKITTEMSASDLLANIVAGKVIQRSILFVEGWTFRDLKETLDESSHIKHEIKNLTNAEIMAKLGHPDQHPEGLFFPDTYFFTWGDSDLTILKQAYQRMQAVLTTQWQQRASHLPYKNSYQALIVASLIEKETGLDNERAKVAGVILLRLKKWMRLQVDPTVLYGLGRPYSSTITKQDLALATPYNTYQRYGLPPTPIDMPGEASIAAALHPEMGDVLYYVSRGDGSHQFSATYKEHRQAVEKYLRRKPSKNNDDLIGTNASSIESINSIIDINLSSMGLIVPWRQYVSPVNNEKTIHFRINSYRQKSTDSLKQPSMYYFRVVYGQ